MNRRSGRAVDGVEALLSDKAPGLLRDLQRHLTVGQPGAQVSKHQVDDALDLRLSQRLELVKLERDYLVDLQDAAIIRRGHIPGRRSARGLSRALSSAWRRASSTTSRKSDTALPIAYGTMLPLAFISDVFFPAMHAPHWLYDVSSAFPVAPVARAMEASFIPATSSWPMPVTGLFVILGWSSAAALVIALAFRWEAGPIRWQRA
jgi:hypothetical protein